MADTSLVFNILAKDKASKTFDSLKGRAGAAGLAIGAALSAGLAGGLMATMDKSKSDALLAAQVGATPEVAAKLGQVSGDLYSKGLGDSIQANNDAIKGVIQNALVPTDASNAAIEQVSAKVMTLGTLMAEESDKVSAAVSTMLKTGMAKSAEEAFDVLTRGTQQGVNKQQDLLDTFTEYPVIFKQLGLDATSSMGLLSQAIAGGARNSDVAADALKEFAIRAQDGSKTSAEAFKALGLNASQMTSAVAAGGPKASAALGQVLTKLKGIKDPAKRAQVAVGLFGTKSEDMQQALMSMDLSKASSQLGNVSGAAQRAGDTLQNSAGAKVEQFKRKLQTGLVNVLGSVVGWIEKHNKVVGTMAMVLGPVVGIIATIVAITKIWTIVQTALNVVMMLNPIGLIVLAVMALIAVIVLIATKTTWFQTIWKTVWGGIVAYYKMMLGLVVSGFKAWWAMFSGFWRGVGNFFVSLWRGIWNNAKTQWNNITSVIGKVVGFVSGLKKRISSAASGMFDGLKNAFRSGINWIISKWNGLSFTLGGGSIMGMSIPSVTLNTPNIPFLAKGGTVTGSGLAVVGEKGPELLSLNRGAQVTPLTGGRSGGSGLAISGGTFNFYGVQNIKQMGDELRKHVRNNGGSKKFFD
ncbi:phage tail tape measure protein [Micromonospora sp. WMMD1274]|uniref:phage tail tape measure protein n=1 Tax=Micromonospora sp. WMMD1274 TaxID=3404116 RepID=UPI003B94F209